MKKISVYILILLLSFIVFWAEYDSKKSIQPNYLYQVYLDDEVLGIIESKKELEYYIDKQGDNIKEKYNVDKVYAPNGLQIKRIITYSNKIDSIKNVYNKLKSLKPFTIKGYQYTIKMEDNNKYIYTTSKEIFKQAISSTIDTYVGKEEYQAYLNNTQEEIITTGVFIDNIYINETIIEKEIKIPVTETIYTDSNTLAKYILFGTIDNANTYIVNAGDTIQKVADNNKIGVEAFLISNPDLTSVDNILYTGQVLSLAVPKPIVTVKAEYMQVEDQEADYVVEEKQDSTMNVGDEEIIQVGEKGLNRVTSKIEKTNGEITYVIPKKTLTLKPSTSQIVLVGTRYQSNIGGRWWSWPTQPGWYISSAYGGRTHPIRGTYSFHQAIDIYVGMWTKIYAANNGTVVTLDYNSDYGYYMVINHNNGYYTLYAHMCGYAKGIKVGSTVGRGQVIAYMGMTGSATGPHLHFETWVGEPWGNSSYHFNPLRLY